MRLQRIAQLIGHAARVAATGAVTVVGLAVITFVIGRFLPADPVAAIVGDRAPPELYAKTFQELRLDRPLTEQLLHHFGALASGDFGVSATTGQPIARDLGAFLPATIELATCSILVGALIGLPLGFVAARHAGRWQDHLVRVVALGNSIPVFWSGLVALLVFYAKLGWTGGPGKLDVGYLYTVQAKTGFATIDAFLSDQPGAFANALSHLILPGSVLGLISLGYVARMTRTLALGESGKDYVQVARLKGLSEGAILRRHILPTVAGPLIAIVAWAYAFMLEGSVLTETVFAWPGIGLYITQSLFAADLRAVLASTFVVGMFYTGLNIFAELIQSAIDPRARPA